MTAQRDAIRNVVEAFGDDVELGVVNGTETLREQVFHYLTLWPGTPNRSLARLLGASLNEVCGITARLAPGNVIPSFRYGRYAHAFQKSPDLTAHSSGEGF